MALMFDPPHSKHALAPPSWKKPRSHTEQRGPVKPSAQRLGPAVYLQVELGEGSRLRRRLRRRRRVTVQGEGDVGEGQLVGWWVGWLD